MRLLLLLLLLLLAALTGCSHQYVTVPGAEVIAGSPQYSYDNVWVGDVAPVVGVLEGDLTLAYGSPLSLRVDFSGITVILPKRVVFLGVDIGGGGDLAGHWMWELSDEEQAQGYADITMEATEERPDGDACAPDGQDVGRCYQQVDDGLYGLGVSVADETSISFFDIIEVDLPPLRAGEDDTCAGFTLDDCCAGDPGISAVACYVLPPCGCPDGTTYGGVQGDGTTMCYCPE